MMTDMKSTIQVGDIAIHAFVVQSEMQPSFGRGVIHPVCSTWDLAHHFELTARKTLEPHLCKDEEGIGSHLSINHCGPAPLGKTVTVEAVITEINETTVVCSITAKIGTHVCATGKQVQRVLPTSTISKLIENATTQ
jgi:predicted thioesterase